MYVVWAGAPLQCAKLEAVLIEELKAAFPPGRQTSRFLRNVREGGAMSSGCDAEGMFVYICSDKANIEGSL